MNTSQQQKNESLLTKSAHKQKNFHYPEWHTETW